VYAIGPKKYWIKTKGMRMSINLRAIKLTWVYAVIFLVVWIWHDWLKTGLFQWLPFILMTSQLIVYWSVQLFLKWKLGKDEK